MSDNVMLIFVNLRRSDAFLSVNNAEGIPEFIATLSPAQATRQTAAAGSVWSVTTLDNVNYSYQVTARDQNRVYLIGSQGLYQVEQATALSTDGSVLSDGASFPVGGGGGGGWP